MSGTIRIPKRFLNHHVDIFERHETVPVLRQAARHYYIAASDSLALRFLVWDAEYWDDFHLAERDTWPLCHSARATHKAIKKAMGWNPDEDLPRPPGQDFEDLQEG